MLFDSIRQFSQHILDLWRRSIGPKLLPLLATVRLVGLALAAIALWLFAYIADEVLETETQSFDTNILLSIQQIHRPWLDTIVRLLTNLGDPTLLVGACGALSLLLLWRKQKSEAMTVAIAAVGALGLNLLLKNLFARHRPELWSRVVDVRYYSFPSGHAMLSMVIYGLIGYWLATRFHRWRGAIAALTTLLILLIGFSRLYLGVHWPTDVIAGYAAGFVWLVTCILSLEIWRQKNHGKKQVDSFYES
jgi:membrane-associated phospholipid phosphatase